MRQKELILNFKEILAKFVMPCGFLLISCLLFPLPDTVYHLNRHTGNAPTLGKVPAQLTTGAHHLLPEVQGFHRFHHFPWVSIVSLFAIIVHHFQSFSIVFHYFSLFFIVFHCFSLFFIVFYNFPSYPSFSIVFYVFHRF
jgi:hypothetical protein